MFENTLVLDNETRRPWTVLAGLTGQLLALGFAMLLPLIFTDQLPAFRMLEFHILAPPGRPQPPPDAMKGLRQQPASRPDFRPPNSLTAPVSMPDHAQIIIDPPLQGAAVYNGPYVDGGVPYTGPGSVNGIPNAISNLTVPPPDVKPRVAEISRPAASVPPSIRVGGDVQAARILSRVIPTYPALAKQARVSGVVQLLGIIGRDGAVQQLRVLSGHPLLVGAALDAVRQWTYRPTLLNGEPVEVVAPIAVHFTLVQ